MTPKKKCDELVGKYLKFEGVKFSESGKILDKEKIKQCALIAVDEILNCIGDMEDPSIFIHGECVNYQDFWQEVKQEIENL